eukprot:TRINITY_DN12725_c0_g1_i2.p1 TRINITY_DN12725_c0_g1~~TRINITY_DN12725_c0_g1_i2.p1  ORF type:complete len:395 (+),score=141.02 TRINITY_DN12725_c0_g1_i2:103-1287(+)
MIRKFVAEGEPAWEGVGKHPGVRVWRIEQFRVVAWPEDQYGEFHVGDSYIVLSTTKKSATAEGLNWDIFYWIGAESTQDEYATAAIKTVELDNWLEDAPVEHRETQGHESMRFKRLFGNEIKHLAGGTESGFKSIEQPAVKEPALYQIKGTAEDMVVTRVRLSREAMNAGDVFLLDDPAGRKLFVWQGQHSSAQEKLRANALAQEIRSFRGGKPSVITVEQAEDRDEGTQHPEFSCILPHKGTVCGCFSKTRAVQTAEDGGSDEHVTGFRPALFRISDASGALEWDKVVQVGAGCCVGNKVSDKGKLSRALLHSEDVFVLDSGFHVYIWQGKGTSAAERVKSMFMTQRYLKEAGRPEVLPVTAIKEQHKAQQRAVFDQFDQFFYTPEDKCCVIM